MKKFNFKSFSRRQSIDKYNKTTNYNNHINSINNTNITTNLNIKKQANYLQKYNKINLLMTLEKILAPENKELLNNVIEIKIKYNTNNEHQELENNTPTSNHLRELERCKIENEVFISTIASLEVAQKICSIFSYNVIKELEINLTPHAEMLIAYQSNKKIKPNAENRPQFVNAVLSKIEELENIVGQYHYYLSQQVEKQINDIQITSHHLKLNVHNYEKILKQFLDQSTLILIEKIILEESMNKIDSSNSENKMSTINIKKI